MTCITLLTLKKNFCILTCITNFCITDIRNTDFPLQTLKTLSNSIDKLKTELSGRNLIKPDTGACLTVKSPEQAKKEILDVELELMTKSPGAEETIELKKKLNELTKVVGELFMN